MHEFICCKDTFLQNVQQGVEVNTIIVLLTLSLCHINYYIVIYTRCSISLRYHRRMKKWRASNQTLTEIDFHAPQIYCLDNFILGKTNHQIKRTVKINRKPKNASLQHSNLTEEFHEAIKSLWRAPLEWCFADECRNKTHIWQVRSLIISISL